MIPPRVLKCLFALVVSLALMGTGCRPSSDTSSSAESKDTPTAMANTLTENERANGWHLLFDGTTTDGWHNYNADTLSSQWQVQDGALVLTGSGGGDIVTDESFGSFELKLEWKISECGNNGLFFHAEEGLDVIWRGAPEYQLLDNTCADDAENPKHRAGANYDLHPPSEDATKPAGQWNQTRLVVDGGHVQHYLNGVKIVDYELWSDAWRQKVENSKFAPFEEYGMAKSGPIGIQDHGDRVWFRNIKIRPLPDEAAASDET